MNVCFVCHPEHGISGFFGDVAWQHKSDAILARIQVHFKNKPQGAELGIKHSTGQTQSWRICDKKYTSKKYPILYIYHDTSTNLDQAVRLFSNDDSCIYEYDLRAGLRQHKLQGII